MVIRHDLLSCWVGFAPRASTTNLEEVVERMPLGITFWAVLVVHNTDLNLCVLLTPSGAWHASPAGIGPE